MSLGRPSSSESRYRRDRATSTVAAFGAMVTASLSIAMGFLVNPGAKHFGVTTAQFLLYFSIFIMTSAIAFSFVGPVIARTGVRLVLIVTGLIAAASMFGMAFAPNIVVFYLLAVPLGVGAAGCNLLSANTLVTGWHVHDRRGTVLGVVACGIGGGSIAWGLLFPPLVRAGGFRVGVLAVAAGFVLFSVLPGIFLARNPPPAEQGLSGEVHEDGPRGKVSLSGFKLVIGTLAVGAMLFSFESAFGSIQPAVYDAAGIDSTIAGYMLSFYAFCGILAKPILGYMYDRFGPKALFAVLATLFLFGLPPLGLALQLDVDVLFPFLALAALSLAIPTVILPLVAVEAVGRDRFPVAYGAVLAGLFIGLAISVPSWGFIFDVNDTYVPAMYGGGVAGLVGLWVVFIAMRLGWRRRQMDVAPVVTLAPASVSEGAVAAPLVGGIAVEGR